MSGSNLPYWNNASGRLVAPKLARYGDAFSDLSSHLDRLDAVKLRQKELEEGRQFLIDRDNDKNSRDDKIRAENRTNTLQDLQDKHTYEKGVYDIKRTDNSKDWERNNNAKIKAEELGNTNALGLIEARGTENRKTNKQRITDELKAKTDEEARIAKVKSDFLGNLGGYADEQIKMQTNRVRGNDIKVFSK